MGKEITRTDAALPTAKEDGWTKEEELSKDIFIRLFVSKYKKSRTLNPEVTAQLAIMAKQAANKFFQSFKTDYDHEADT